MIDIIQKKSKYSPSSFLSRNLYCWCQPEVWAYKRKQKPGLRLFHENINRVLVDDQNT